MKKTFFSLILLASTAAAPALAELTPEETAVRTGCVANIANKVYDPAEAEKCLTSLKPDSPLYKKMKAEEEDTLTYVLKYENMFKELGEFFKDGPRECLMRRRYLEMLETDAYQEGCVLCDLDMGPQPDKTFPWIGKYYGGQLPVAQRAALSWNEAGAPRAATLAKIGVTAARWNDLKLSERTAVIMAETAISSGTSYPREITSCNTFNSNPQQYLNRYLPADIRANIRAYFAAIMPAPQPAGTGSSAANPSKYADASKRAKEMAGKSDGELMAYLGGMFDNKAGTAAMPDYGKPAKPAPAAAKPKGGPEAYKLPEENWNKVAEELNVRMVGGVSSMDKKKREAAFSGTPLEDELRKFYTEKGKDGKPLHPMKLKLLDLGELPGTNGAYCPKFATNGCGNGHGPGEIAVNSQLVEQWMAKNNVTAKQLMASPALMDKLARSVYPVTLHEGIHNVHQDEYYIANGIDNKRMLDKEVVAFSGQAAGVKHKLVDPKTRKLYEGEMDDFSMEVLAVSENGGYRGMKKFVRYYNLEGTQGAAAKSFSQMEAGLKELNLRKTEPGYDNPAARTADNCSWFSVQDCSTEQLTAMTKKAYPWYEVAVKRQESDIAMVNDEMARLNAADKSARWKKIQAAQVKPIGE